MTNKKLFSKNALICIFLTCSSVSVYANENKTDSIVRFDIVRFNMQGNTLLSEQEINQVLAPYAHQDQDFASVQKAVAALKLAYHQKGYDLVQVVLPEQELNHGVVQLKVIETKIGKVTITGNTFFDEANIRRSLPALQENQSPNIAAISTNLKVANTNPQKKSTLQFQSENQEGVVDATVKVADEKFWSGAITVDNTGDLQTGRNRITGAFQYANVADLDHVLNMQYTTSVSHPSDVKIFGVGYHIPFYSLGDSLDFYAIYSNVDSGTVNVGGGLGLAISGNGKVAGTRYNHNFIKKGDYDSELSAGLDYKAFNNNISFIGVPLGNDVTVHPISLTYTGNWAVVGTSANFYLSGFHNIPGGSHGTGDDIQAARSGANANYNIVRYGAGLIHAFTGDWEVRFLLNGQITSDALIPGEQFGIGGANSVRGFLEREIIDDEGYITNLEFYTPSLCKGDLQCRLLTFYDTGYVSRNSALPGELGSQSIGSVGLGFRANLAPHWTAQADWAYVVNGSTLNPTGSNRAHFKVVATF